ncbi:GFA family protein [Aliiroseovarius subalbicans]|uniref:GFA family protein n=1 Tax=Aliiroseovarius subalbicans TaxID=2925840 RepID=UPI001F58C576|nr:GFA family protein [Aliiroseovarius subalbicans]MCI2399035.1 GFA family protein [Aliiroseovarius subalbicans]
MTRSHRSTCHCGAVKLQFTLTDGLSTARRCNCSYCARRGTIAVTAPTADVRIVQGADKLSLYQFNTNTAKHWFCSICGISTHHQRRSDPSECGVNAACIKGVDVTKLGNIPWGDGRNHSKDQ